MLTFNVTKQPSDKAKDDIALKEFDANAGKETEKPFNVEYKPGSDENTISLGKTANKVVAYLLYLQEPDQMLSGSIAVKK